MGGAVFASLDGQSNFATVPERVQLALRGSSDRAATAHKSDRLPRPSESDAQRRVIRDTRTGRVGDREVVRVRAFVASPAIWRFDFRTVADIPAFDPRKCRRPRPRPARRDRQRARRRIDAEVPSSADLGTCCRERRSRRCLDRDMLSAFVTPPTRPAARRRGSSSRKCRAIRGSPMPRRDHDPCAGFEARLCPGKWTLLPSPRRNHRGTAWKERTVASAGVNRDLACCADSRRPDDMKAIGGARFAQRGGGVRETASCGFCWPDRRQAGAADPCDDHQQPAIEAVVAWSDLGRYVQVNVRDLETEWPAASTAAGGRGGRRPGHAALKSSSGPRSQSGAASADRGPDPHLFVRRRFPAPGAAGRLVRGAVCRRENGTDTKARC